MSLRVLVVGDTQAPELAWAIERLARHATVTCLANVAEAVRWCSQHAPDAVMLAASRPGQFSAADPEALHGAAPLARLVALLGPWCEGEVRTGSPWPGVTRVYWHQAELAVCYEMLHCQGTASWSLPRTASVADRLLYASDGSQTIDSKGGCVAVRATQLDTFEALADALRSAGLNAHWWRAPAPLHPQNPRAVVWDLDHFQPGEQALLAQHAALYRDVPWIALLGFPRLTELEQLQALGITYCLAKPLRITELWEALARLPVGSSGPAAKS